MPRINHWWTTRPKRKLTSVVDILRVFLTVTDGAKWKGNRKLSVAFEEALEGSRLKGGDGVRRDQGGGGGRTYAAWLGSFGLWFMDRDGIARPTFAGDDLLKGEDPVPIITHQLLNYQFPSPFSKRTRVDPRFRLQPFKFLLRLMIDSRLDGFITEKEIAAFVITRAETASDLDEVVKNIVRARKSRGAGEIFDSKFEKDFGKITKIKDTANTFVNQLEYSQLIERDGDGKIYVPPAQKARLRDLIDSAPNMLTRVDEIELFQRAYGLGPNHRRDNRTFSSNVNVTAVDAERSKILLALFDVLANQPIKTFDAAVLTQIAQKTGVSTSKIEKIISVAAIQPSYDSFEEKFLRLSMDGRESAIQFERAIEGVFGVAGLGFYTKWIGSSPKNPDVLAIATNAKDEYSGIIDAKAYKEYTILNDHHLRMAHEYIPKFSKYTHDGREVSLSFFAYVAGGFGTTIDRGIKKLNDKTGIDGSVVTAQNLLLLLKHHRAKPFSSSELKNLLTSNKEILSSDFSR